jgi:hypothetical protein
MNETCPRHASPTVLILAVGCAIATTGAIFFAMRTPASQETTIASDGHTVPARELPVTATAFTQSDSVSPGGKFTNQVFYPIPYSSPPNLKLHCEDKKRVYEIVKEDEFGFTWLIRPSIEDFTADVLKVSKPEDLLRFTFDGYSSSNFKPNLQFADFTYEAKGVRGSGMAPRPFEQTGTFNTLANTDGEVIFPIPYAAPANVELSGNASSYMVVTECKATGFKWKNKPDPTWISHASGTITWKAKGQREK